MAREEQHHALRVKLFFRQSFAFFLDIDQQADEILTLVASALGNGGSKEIGKGQHCILGILSLLDRTVGVTIELGDGCRPLKERLVHRFAPSNSEITRTGIG
jgi:hypothetical protein